MRESTLIFLTKPNEKKILLAMKKRSFGEGKWNGVGGKLENGETAQEAVVRETREEILVGVDKADLEHVATIDFFHENKPDWDQRVIVFCLERWTGEPTETEEMSPKWFHYDEIPYDKMWLDDKHWLPKIIDGEKIKASFKFNDLVDSILEFSITPLF